MLFSHFMWLCQSLRRRLRRFPCANKSTFRLQREIRPTSRVRAAVHHFHHVAVVVAAHWSDSRAASALRNTCWAIYCKACNGIQSICSMDEVAASEQGLLGVANSLLTRTTLYTDKRSVRPDKSPRVSGGLFLCVLKLLKAAAALAMECPRSSFFRLKQHGERCKPVPICQLKRPLLALGSEDITSSILRLQCFVASSTVFLRRESGASSSDTEASEMWASGS